MYTCSVYYSMTQSVICYLTLELGFLKLVIDREFLNLVICIQKFTALKQLSNCTLISKIQ